MQTTKEDDEKSEREVKKEKGKQPAMRYRKLEEIYVARHGRCRCRRTKQMKS